MTETNYKRINCAHCGVEFSTQRDTKRYCRKSCKLAAWRTANPKRNQAHRDTEHQKPNGQLCVVYAKYCAVCNKAFVSRGNRAHCSRACEPKSERVSILPESMTCRCCGNSYTPASIGGRPKVYCSDVCANLIDSARRRIYKGMRKALLRRATIENVDPFKVFDRDGWRCQLCGTKTPKSKRGTYDDNAPELDHINPLSLGGEHSYLNTQCACRKCNITKSNKPAGQMLLVG